MSRTFWEAPCRAASCDRSEKGLISVEGKSPTYSIWAAEISALSEADNQDPPLGIRKVLFSKVVARGLSHSSAVAGLR